MNWHEYFDFVDGALFWKADRPDCHFSSPRGHNIWRVNHAGKRAGFVSGIGYAMVKVNGRSMLAHRIIWEMHHGPIPEDMEIDHINGVRDDNRLCNLRLASVSQNRCNKKTYSNNKAGLKGVSLSTCGYGFRARIQYNGKPRYIGLFKTEAEACDAYRRAEIELFGEFARETNKIR